MRNLDFDLDEAHREQLLAKVKSEIKNEAALAFVVDKLGFKGGKSS
jgi:hypothetical protein